MSFPIWVAYNVSTGPLSRSGKPYDPMVEVYSKILNIYRPLDDGYIQGDDADDVGNRWGMPRLAMLGVVLRL